MTTRKTTDIKKGDRVTWIDYRSDAEIKGEVLKVFRNGRAQVLSADFEKFSIELNRLRVKQRQITLIEVPEVEEKPINHWEMEEDFQANGLPPTNLPPTNLLAGHWIEKKIIHGDIYLYERWREEVEVKGIKKRVKRSKYLEKVAADERITN